MKEEFKFNLNQRVKLVESEEVLKEDES